MKVLDKVIVVTLVVLSAASAGIVMLKYSGKGNSIIVIRVSGQVVKQVPLTKSVSSKIYDFSFKDNIGHVEVKEGKVRMLKMDKTICPNGICSDTGWISKSYQNIVCLPNSIIVTLEQNKQDKIDSLSF